MRWTIYLLSFYLCWNCFHGFTQIPMYEHYGKEKGLFSTNVYRALTDSNNAWLGTEDGLIHYDGIDFTAYPFFENGVYNNTVLSMATAPTENAIYLCLYWNGLFRFDTEQYTLKQVTSSSESGKLVHLERSSDGVLWGVNISHQLFRLQDDSLKLQLPETYIHTIEWHNDTLWVASANGLLFSTPPYGEYNYHQATIGKEIINIHVRDQLSPIIVTPNALYTLHKNDLKKYLTPRLNSPIALSQVDRFGNAWLVLKDGSLHKVQFESDVSTLIPIEPYTNQITQLTIDPYQRLWATTEGAGVFVFETQSRNEFYPIKGVHELAIDSNGTLWCGGFGQLSSVTYHEHHVHYLDGIADKAQIKWMGQGPSGWMISTAAQSWYLEKKWKSWSSEHGMLSVAQTSKDWWFGHYNGLHTLDELMSRKEDKKRYFPYDRVNDLVIDKNQNVWIGTVENVYTISKKHDTIKHPISQHLKGSIVHDLFVDENSVWAAFSTGLAQLTDSSFTLFLVEDGIPHPNCRSIAKDQQDRLWVTTEGGLFYLKDGTFILYKLHNQAITDSPTTVKVDTTTNALWVAYPECVVRIDLDELEQETVFPKTQVLPIGNQNDQRSYTYNASPLRFEIKAKGLLNYPDFKPQYRLLPLDSTWIDLTNSLLILNTLQPNDYQLQVKWKHEYKNLEVPIVTHSFSILPLFYQTWWFVSFIIIVGLTLVAFIVYRIVKSIQIKAAHKMARERQLHQLHQQALANSLHPHYLTNSLLSLRSYIEQHTKEMGTKYIQAYTQLIRLNLEDARHPFQSLENEIARLELYLQLEKWNSNPSFDYEIRIDQEIDDTSDYIIPGMVIQPLVENAIKHGLRPLKSEGYIMISILLVSEDMLQIIVEDNGVGIQKHAQKSKQAFGLNLIREKLDWSNRTYDIQFEPVNASDTHRPGTRVILELEASLPTLPLSQ